MSNYLRNCNKWIVKKEKSRKKAWPITIVYRHCCSFLFFLIMSCIPLFLKLVFTVIFRLRSSSFVNHHSRLSNYTWFHQSLIPLYERKKMRNVTQSHTIHASRFFLKTETQTDKHNMIPGELSVVGCHNIAVSLHSLHICILFFSGFRIEKWIRLSSVIYKMF